MSTKLALPGGPKTVTRDSPDTFRWPRTRTNYGIGNERMPGRLSEPLSGFDVSQ